MHHNLQEPAITVGTVSALKHNSVMSAINLSEANYITVIIPENLLIYDVNKVEFWASVQAIITWWGCKTSGMCRGPIKPKVENENVDTMLLNCPDPG